ncbi:DNA-processing protein DprA [candidate division KSB1 bacterium]|nr:DNA-processing protein DprA [candidate division KSB1 bacterium]
MSRWSAKELCSLLQLLSVPRIGGHKIRLLIERFHTPSAVLRASIRELVQVHGIERTCAENIKTKSDLRFAENQMLLSEKSGIHILTYWDSNFPPSLKRIYDPPILLYVRGTLASGRKIAIVGTRQPSPYGGAMAEKFSRELVLRGFFLVSGLARGVDTRVHRTCVQNGGITFAVLGSGCDRVYPPENRSLTDSIIATSGSIISEYPLGTGPEAMNFPRRNRIIAGLSEAVLVIEAGESSGALITAEFACDEGREVFAVPGNINSDKSLGTNLLIQQGAKLVRNVDDITEELQPQKETVSGTQLPLLTLDEEEEHLLLHLSDQPQQIDDLVRNTDFSLVRLHTVLLNLELKGAIKQLPGKFFLRL